MLHIYRLINHTILITLLLVILVALLSSKDIENRDYRSLLNERIQYIIKREYSIASLDDILIGIVNYPQWFVSMSTGLYNGLAFHKSIRGGEGLYPTNISHDRWIFNFNYHTSKDISICARKIQGWASDETLELVMYSQVVNICLSSDIHNLQDNEQWYDDCWLGYVTSKCKINITMEG